MLVVSLHWQQEAGTTACTYHCEQVTLLGVQILSDDMDIEGTAEQSTNHMVHVYFNR